MKKEEVLSILTIVSIFIILFILIIYTPIINKYRNNGELIINEVMASNKSTIIDSLGNKSDYIELYNGYDYDINLENYFLADDNFDTKKWMFPSVIIKTHDYLLVYASGLNLYENELHTNFKLDSKGEVVTLSNPSGKSISKLYYLETMDDTSYGYNGHEYVYFYHGTPNMANDSEYSLNPIIAGKVSVNLSINEYMTNNINAFKSSDGNYYGVIELYNDEDDDLNLKGYYLSDNEKSPYKYLFPEVIIPSKGYLVIYASGLDKYDGELHTNFNLDNSDNVLILSDKYKKEIEKLYIKKLQANTICGYYQNSWYYYSNNSFGRLNSDNYLKSQDFTKDIDINEVSISPVEAIEIRNLTGENLNLANYSIGDKSNVKVNFPNVTLKAYGYYVVYGSDNYSYTRGKLYTGFHINNATEKLYIYANNMIIDEYEVGKLTSGVSSGLDINGKRVFYEKVTLGSENSSDTYLGYTKTPEFSLNGGYVPSGTKVLLSSSSDSVIYYTLDGSFPTTKSLQYTGEITINKTTVIKAVAYQKGYLVSDIVSRTYLVGRAHDLAYISISTNSSNLFASNGLLSNYYADLEKKVSFEFYEADGTLGTSFVAGLKLTGMDSRIRPQKSMAIYLRKEYGLTEVSYPFFKEGETLNYSSFTLRNSGEDPFGIRLQDTSLTYALKGQMDLDMQDYRAVVVYLNGEYYGLYNMREKLNGDYIESKYGIKKGNFDLIKYTTAMNGSRNNYNSLVSYIKSHNPANTEVYEYLKTQIDMQELCNYLIVESYYGNTDLGNIKYWKANNGKWRFMLYDLDWSLWNTKLSMGYTVLYKKNPSGTYLSSLFVISRQLYNNSEFKDLYLSILAYHLKKTFVPSRMNEIVDELYQEIYEEMPYHIKRWGSNPSSMSNWENGVNSFKKKLTNRYNYVLSNVKSDFNLSNSEYSKYFGDI